MCVQHEVPDSFANLLWHPTEHIVLLKGDQLKLQITMHEAILRHHLRLTSMEKSRVLLMWKSVQWGSVEC